MTDFKVGDKVKTTVNVLGWEKELPKGTVTTVTKVESFQMAQVRIPGTDSTGICHFKELALIEPKLEIGDKVRVLIGSPLNESKGTIATVGCINSGTLVTCRTSIPYDINWVYSLDEIERVDMLKVGGMFTWQYGTADGSWKDAAIRGIVTDIDSDYLWCEVSSLVLDKGKLNRYSGGVYRKNTLYYRVKPEDYARIDWPEAKTEDEVKEVVKEVVTEQEPKLKFRVGDRVQKFLRLAPGAEPVVEPVVEPVEVCKKPKSLKKRVKDFIQKKDLETLGRSNVELSVTDCYEEVIASITDPKVDNDTMSQSIVESIAYLTQLYGYYRELE